MNPPSFCISSRNNKSREYFYFYENEMALINYCETNHISVSPNVSGSASLCNSLGNGEVDVEKVRFSSKLRLKKIDGYSKGEFEDLLQLVLRDNYPEFG